MEAFLALIAEGKVTPKRLVTHRFPIAQAEKAYELMERGEPHLAMVLTYKPEKVASIARQISLVRQPAPVNGIRVAFIGMGNYAKAVLFPAVRKGDGAPLTTVVTSTGISAGHAGEKYGFKNVATDPAAALTDPNTNIVFTATRNDTHAR